MEPQDCISNNFPVMPVYWIEGHTWSSDAVMHRALPDLPSGLPHLLCFPPGIQVFTLSQELSRVPFYHIAAFPLPGFLYSLFVN